MVVVVPLLALLPFLSVQRSFECADAAMAQIVNFSSIECHITSPAYLFLHALSNWRNGSTIHCTGSKHKYS